MTKKILAVDVGASGGLAWFDGEAIQARAMPDTNGDIISLLRSIRACGVEEVFIEQVGGYCGVGQPGSAMFAFGKNCGICEGACMMAGFSVRMVTPQKWQKDLGLGKAPQCASKGDWKRKLKGEAQRRFPNVDVTLKTADALLILDYASRQLL